MNLTKKIGPLPVWAWGLLLGVVGYYAYTRYSSSSSTSSTASTTPTTQDPNAIDPSTGLTYGQEESAALNAGAATAAAPADSTLGATTDPATETTAFDQELQAFLQAQQDLQAVATGLGYTPPNTSSTTQAATTSPPMAAKATAPSTSASAHTSELAIAGGAQGILAQANKAIRDAGARASSAARADAARAGQLLHEAATTSNPFTARKLAAEARAAAAKARAAQATANRTATRSSAVESFGRGRAAARPPARRRKR